MPMRHALLPEFDQEMAATRRTLERVPAQKFGWKPHTKSFDMGHLAFHVAQIPGWLTTALTTDSLDVEPGGVPVPQPPAPATPEALLAGFDKNVVEARAALAAADDVSMGQPWSLLSNGNELLKMPRAAVLRTFVLSHLIHHRAQLGLYLRLNDVPVPATYGPSADEQSM